MAARYRAIRSELRPLAAAAWKTRWEVELEAEARFARLAERMESIGAATAMVALARRASQDERRHAGLCADLALSYGASLPCTFSPSTREIAPSGLLLRGQVLYEVVAACCITETESMGVLTTLLEAVRSRDLRQVLRELARDEVGHSRLGWAHLASEHAQGATSFLGPLVPSMLAGSVDASLLVGPTPDANMRGRGAIAEDDLGLVEHGVLPRAQKIEVFRRTLLEVVFPGLSQLGVDTGPARSWLARRFGQGAGPAARFPPAGA